MRAFWFIFPFVLLLACQNVSEQNNTASPKSNASGLKFVFSDTRFSGDLKDPGNWCNARHGGAALVSADPNNFYRRLFALGTIPSRVVVDYGNMSAAFMLYKIGNEVHIYTGENLPVCLSVKSSFQLSPGGQSFRYDNKREISFDVYLQEMPGGIQIALDLPVNGGHGLTVFQCEECQ